jgi:hypothetical protein
LICLFITGCSEKNDGINSQVRQYFAATEGKNLDIWKSDRWWGSFLTGIFWNAIPGLHIAGVWIDTFFVWQSVDDTAMGVGAILAKQKNCPHLLQPDDYDIVVGLWGGAIDKSDISIALSTIESFKEGEKLGQAARLLMQNKSKDATRIVTQMVRGKLYDKVSGKLFGKYAVKIGSKKSPGSFRFLGLYWQEY